MRAALLLATLAACAAPARVETWGTMRAVLREGRTEGRVELARVVRPGTFGLGALEGLTAEVTVDDGVLHLAAVDGGRLVRPDPAPGDSATLLVLASVAAWSESDPGPLADLAALEDAVRAAAAAEPGPIPFRLEGSFSGLDLHVLDHSCPIADPDGPPPWRLRDARAEGVLVGFYAEGSAGVLTHHGQRSHVHAVVRTAEGTEVSGHVDALRVDSARLYVPD